MLKINQRKLDQISPTDPITPIIRAWFHIDVANRWEELYKVLLQPAVYEPSLAKELRCCMSKYFLSDSAIVGMPERSLGYQERKSFIGKVIMVPLSCDKRVPHLMHTPRQN